MTRFNPQPMRCVGVGPTAECRGESEVAGEQKREGAEEHLCLPW